MDEQISPTTPSPKSQQEPTDIPSPVQQPTQEKKSKKWLTIGVVVLASVILGMTGFFAYRNYKLKKPFPLPITRPQQIPTSITLSPTLGPSESWKVYRNEKYGYEAKYPSGWLDIEADPKINPQLLLEGEMQKVTFVKSEVSWRPKFTIRVLSNPRNQTLEQWTKDRYAFERVTGEKVDQRIGPGSLDNQPTIKALRFQYDLTTFAAAALYKGVFYEIEYDSMNPNDLNFEENIEIYQKIYSTFKFLD